MTMKPSELVQELVSHLGAPLTALVGGVKDTRSVRQWMASDGSPRDAALVRLRSALQIVDVLKLRFEDDVVKAWFTGMNPLLEDRSPILILADEDEASFTAVLQAARRFVSEQ
jgi:hypothetical protein